MSSYTQRLKERLLTPEMKALLKQEGIEPGDVYLAQNLSMPATRASRSKPPTTSELFGFNNPEERNAYINTISREAYLGGEGKDIAGVAANLLSRRLANYGGSSNMLDIVTQPHQYEANFNLSKEQLSKPNAGGFTTDAYNRIVQIAENPLLVGKAFQQTRGPLSFRGQALLKNKKQGDVMLEDKGNFYFDSLTPALYQKGLNMFNQGSTASATNIPATTPGTVVKQESVPDTSEFLNAYLLESMSNQNRRSNSPGARMTQALKKSIMEGGTYEYPNKELY